MRTAWRWLDASYTWRRLENTPAKRYWKIKNQDTVLNFRTSNNINKNQTHTTKKIYRTTKYKNTNPYNLWNDQNPCGTSNTEI